MKGKVNLKSKIVVYIKDYDEKITTHTNIIYLNGKVDGLVEQDYTINPLFSKEKLLKELPGSLSLISGKFSIISTSRKEEFEFLANDLTGITEIYYVLRDSYLIFSDNILELLNSLETLNFDFNEFKFFIEHDHCRPGKTYYKEILRIPPGKFLKIKDSQLIIESYSNFNGLDVDYKIFKNSFKSAIENNVEDSKHQKVLFSGGVDSTAILGTLKNNNDEVSAVTFAIEPEFSFNYVDIKRSKEITKAYDIQHDFLKVDLENLKNTNLLQLIPFMPFAKHLNLNFLETFRKFNKEDSVIWCGQNSDTLYNLGPTDKLGFFHRFLLSKPYIKMLNDVKGSNKYVIFKKFFDLFIKSYYKLVYGINYKTPHDLSSLIQYLLESSQYLALNSSNDLILNHDFKGLHSADESCKILFDEKVGSFYTGGTNKSVYYTAEFINSTVIMPYSNSNMFLMFKNLVRSWKDIFFSKRFLYKYVYEELDINKRIFNQKIKVDNSIPNLASWEKKVFETKFGSELKNFAGIDEETIQNRNNLMNFVLAYVWLNKMNEVMLKNNVEVLIP